MLQGSAVAACKPCQLSSASLVYIKCVYMLRACVWDAFGQLWRRMLAPHSRHAYRHCCTHIQQAPHIISLHQLASSHSMLHCLRLTSITCALLPAPAAVHSPAAGQPEQPPHLMHSCVFQPAYGLTLIAPPPAAGPGTRPRRPLQPLHSPYSPCSPYTASSYTWLLPYHLRQRALVSLSASERLRHKLSLMASGQDMTIAAVGGSSTHCQGSGTQRAEDCWVGRLQQLLRDHVAYVDATAAPAAGAAAGGAAGAAGGGGGGHGAAAGRQGARKPGSVSYAAAAPGTEEPSGSRKLQAAAAGLGRAQVVNCAVPNTMSAFAAACAQLLVPDSTDIVVVEYAVDDPAVGGGLQAVAALMHGALHAALPCACCAAIMPPAREHPPPSSPGFPSCRSCAGAISTLQAAPVTGCPSRCCRPPCRWQGGSVQHAARQLLE